jgi:hypothetical protein
MAHRSLLLRLRQHWLVTLLLAFMAALQVSSSILENQTYDEGVHLSAGLTYLRTGDYRLNREHPPLGKMLSALPLLLTKARLPLEHPTWGKRDGYEFSRQFLYYNNLGADQLLLLGRLSTVLLTVLLGVALAWWTRREFGAKPALLAIFLYATDPNIIAHGRYVTTDLIAALVYFLAIVTWTRYLYLRSAGALLISGLALGLALVSKFSTFTLPGILLMLYIIRWIQKRELSFLRLVGSFAVLLAIASAVILVVYWPETRHMGDLPRLAESVDKTRTVGYVFRRFGQAFRLPAHPYLMGLYDVLNHNADGHASYLLGMQSKDGWWYYFPVAFAVKSPTAVLLLTAAAVVAVVLLVFRRFRAHGDWFRWIALGLPAALYFGLSMTAGINIGIRHLLPVYPFLYALIGAAFFRLPLVPTARKLMLAGLVLVQVLEVGSVHPHYLAFFNRPAGGPLAGPQYLVDSNIDWGQDLKKLKRYMDAHNLDHVCLGYFGSGDVRYYGIDEWHLPWSTESEELRKLDCVGVISVTILQDVYLPPGSFAWLRRRKPIDNVGYSLWVYDLRKK